ncbi:putative queuosine precursor transporter [Pseudodesulfovibrio profundus]|uniref:Probable queuosine precursor transporter n=1 Tax=Pseudodesulfovibrio profundus TaxID=57320 RepID=A0A2C8F7V5_9BACT|nr:queuosine precursor transporter [Pseudodesulfovibrio profundus]SOB58528.1 putative queuosine precursor transporter [Pseudodesulfovibrio profundus]
MNETLWILFALVDLCMVLAVYRFFGRVGLFGLMVFNLLLCNIQVLKTVELFGLTTTLGNVLYASVFLATDLLSEFYGKKEAQKGVLLGFVTLLMMVGYMQIALLFQPATDDFAQPHLQALFGFMPRIALASMFAYLVSQMHDVWAFHAIKQRTGGKMLWLRNNASTMISQFLDSAIFCTIAFWGVFPLNIFMEIMLSTYIIKVAVAALDTPFIYLAKRLFRKDHPAAKEA